MCMWFKVPCMSIRKRKRDKKGVEGDVETADREREWEREQREGKYEGKRVCGEWRESEG